jgi:drug/metabolite transporter (DMT)-like permease
MSQAIRPATAGVFLALTAAALYGVMGAVAADVFDVVSPARVSQIRAFITAAVLIPYAWHRGLLDPKGQLPMLAVLGLNLALVGLTFYWALDRLGVGPGATMQYLGPFIVLGWMALVQRRSVSRFTWLAAAVAILGVVLIAEAWAYEDLDVLGLASGVTTASLFAGYFLLGEHLGKTLPALTMITWGFVFASLFWLLVLPVWSFPSGLSGSVWVKLVWVGIGGTALPFLAQFAALRRVASGIVGVVATAEPVVAAAAAWVILDQSLTAVQIAGGLIVVLAVAAVHRWSVVDVEQPLDGVF